MKKLFARLVVLMTFVSCMQENELNPPQPLDVSIKAVATDTRTVLDGNDVKWENNDEIALLLVGDEKVVVNFKTAIDGDEPTAEADFTGTIAPEVREKEYQQSIAIYPSTAVTGEGEISFSLPQKQTVGADGSFESGLNLSSAAVSFDELAKSGEAEAKFKNALAILRFTLPENITEVSLTGTSPLAGNAPLVVVDNELGISEAVEWENQILTVSPKLSEGSSIFESDKTYNLLVWPGVHNSLTVKMTDNDGCVYEKTVEGKRTFEASKYYTLNFNSVFGKEFSATLSGREFAAEEQVAVVLGELYNETLTVAVEESTATISGSLPHTDETVNGYAVYPASVAEGMTFTIPDDQTQSEKVELYTVSLSSNELLQEDASLEFTDALVTLNLTLPEGTQTVKVSSTYPFVGTAPLKVEDNKLVVDRDHWSENKGNSVSATPSDNKAEVVVFPGTYTLTVTLTDDDNCTIHKEFHEKEYKGEETLDLSSREFSKQYTVECDNDIEGPIMVAFDEKDPVEVAKDGKFVYNSHETYTTGFAFYPTDADTEGVSVPANQTEETEKPELMSSSLNFVSNTAEAQFTNAFVTLNLKVPEGTTKVTLTSDDTPLAGTMKVVNKEVVIDENPDNATEVTLTDFTGTDCKIYVLPGTHTSLMAAIEDATGTATKSFSNQTFEAGQTVILDLADGLLRPVTLNPTATAQHTFVEGVLTGTELLFDFGVTSEEAGIIDNLNITVTRDGVTYRTYNGKPGAVASISVSGGKHYLPRNKEFSIEYEYTSVGKTIKSTMTVTSPDLTESQITRNLEISINDKVITIEEARINISQEVLEEMPLSGHYCGFKYNSDTGSMTKMNLSPNQGSAVIYENQTYELANYGNYYLYLYLYFDDILIYLSKEDGVKTYKLIQVNEPPKYYRIVGEKINNSQDLQNGGNYVICLQSASNSFWSNSDNRLTVKDRPSDDRFTKDYVFTYRRDDNQKSVSAGIGANYSYASAGAWQSLLGTYLTHDFNFNNYSNYFTCANGWRGATNQSLTTSYDIDIYKNGSDMINYYNGEFVWGNHGTENYKWNIYKVELEQ